MTSSTDLGPSRRSRRLLFPVLFVALCIGVTELGLQLARAIINAGKLPNRQYLLSPYHGQDWAKPLFREMLRTGYQYDPLLGFRERPFAGTYVNIGANSRRKTWNAAVPPTVSPPVLLVFGGSTVWGWGARDDHTIPSYLSKSLSERGVQYRVWNCGQKGYTFTQEVLQLIRLLQEGERPDLVVFCDGFNDVLFSYRAGRADVTYEFEENKWRFEAGDLEVAGLALANWVEEHSLIVGTASKMARRTGLKARTRYGTDAPVYTDQALGSLAGQIADARVRTLDLVGRLARAYGFRYECYWQPAVFCEERLTEEEAKIGPAEGDRPFGDLFRGVQGLMNAKRLQHHHDISDVFRGREASVYLDFAHVSEAGNRLVAAKIGGILLREGGLEQARDHR